MDQKIEAGRYYWVTVHGVRAIALAVEQVTEDNKTFRMEVLDRTGGTAVVYTDENCVEVESFIG